MKVNIKQLKRIIKQTINEVQSVNEVPTPGDDRYGMAGDARGGVPGRSSSRGVTFPGHDDDYTVIRKGFDDDEQAGQGLSAASGEYIDGVGWVDDDGNIWAGPTIIGQHDEDLGDRVDDEMKDGGRSKDDFFMVIDSQVTRGKAGEIMHPQSNGSFSVQEERSKGTLSGDLYWCYQKANRASAKNRAKEVIDALMKHDIVGESTIDDDLIEEFGIRGRDSNKFYGIIEYFQEFNNGSIRESKNMSNLLKRKRRSRI